MFLFSAVCSLIGVVTWGIKIKTWVSVEDYRLVALGWSFGLGVAHCMLALIGGSVAFLAASETKPQHQLFVQD